MEPSDKQIKEFWEWCGLTFQRDKGGTLSWYDLEGDFVDFGYPDIDLNNLFKYAVSVAYVKLFTDGRGVRQSYKTLFAMWLEKFFEGYGIVDALFWALWQVKEDIDAKRQR